MQMQCVSMFEVFEVCSCVRLFGLDLVWAVLCWVVFPAAVVSIKEDRSEFADLEGQVRTLWCGARSIQRQCVCASLCGVCPYPSFERNEERFGDIDASDKSKCDHSAQVHVLCCFYCHFSGAYKQLYGTSAVQAEPAVRYWYHQRSFFDFVSLVLFPCSCAENARVCENVFLQLWRPGLNYPQSNKLMFQSTGVKETKLLKKKT